MSPELTTGAPVAFKGALGLPRTQCVFADGTAAERHSGATGAAKLWALGGTSRQAGEALTVVDPEDTSLPVRGR